MLSVTYGFLICGFQLSVEAVTKISSNKQSKHAVTVHITQQLGSKAENTVHSYLGNDFLQRFLFYATTALTESLPQSRSVRLLKVCTSVRNLIAVIQSTENSQLPADAAVWKDALLDLVTGMRLKIIVESWNPQSTACSFFRWPVTIFSECHILKEKKLGKLICRA